MSRVGFAERLVERLASGPLRAGTSRRGFLAKATIGGAALAVQPWTYLTRPADAYTVCTGGGTDNTCAAGYTVFCCTVNHGNNTCPPGTFAGGWWKADRSSYCGGSARYYIDCNALPGHHFACTCNTTGCDHRLHACNVFRYGQCNTHIAGTTAVVCRQISCTPPWKLYPGACSTSSATDNNTAGHHAPCLSTPPRLLAKGASSVHTGGRLQSGAHLTSPKRHVMLSMQADGNLVLHDAWGVVRWSTRTAHKAVGGQALLQRDGNLVVMRKDGHAVWQSGTAHKAVGGSLVVEDSGSAVIRNSAGHPVWSTHTPI